MQRPDYETARANAGFRWSVGSGQSPLTELSGIPIREFNLNPKACIEAYRVGRARLRELFGPEVQPPALSTPHVSYGHVNGLGSQLLFPEGGEVGHTHIYGSLREGIAALKQPVDFATAGMAPFYLDFRRQMQEAFPGEEVGFTFGLEGPITTAWELRGEGFFTDIYDDPAAAATFMALSTESIVAFHRFTASVRGAAAVNPSGAGMCDDLASMMPPALWPTLVLPFWEMYYAGMTTGTRSAHVEDLRRAQLPFLEDIGLSYYDPSISHRLNPPIIAANCRVPFGWRLGSFHYYGMSADDVRDFVFQSVADGACAVFTYAEASICREPHVAKVAAFIAAAKEVERCLDAGGSREEIGSWVSPAGRAKLWGHWPE
ncbi:MAG: uroporphyrinogen decarboxylase/cobalamine-independent methonine synthase family protein [Anaerolineae bacterium]